MPWTNESVITSSRETKMPRVIITAQVEDSTQWEKGFRTQGALLRSMSSTVTHFAANENNEVVLHAEPADLDQYFAVLESPATAEAMAQKTGAYPKTRSRNSAG